MKIIPPLSLAKAPSLGSLPLIALSLSWPFFTPRTFDVNVS